MGVEIPQVWYCGMCEEWMEARCERETYGDHRNHCSQDRADVAILNLLLELLAAQGRDR